MKRIIAFFLLTLFASSAIGQQKELMPGDNAPLFNGVNQTGKQIQLSALLEKGKVVVMFYRGNWCPYCNRQLKAYQDSLLFIQAKGATLVAITPEQPAYIRKTIEKTDASFSILYDHDLSIMKAYKVAFTVDATAMTRLKNVGIDLAETNGNNSNTLPVPGVFIINQQGKIDFVYFDPNYRNRLSVKEMLSHL